MTPEERARLKSLISQRIANLSIPIGKAVTLRKAYQAAVDRLEAQSNTYSPDYIETNKANEREEYRGKLSELRPDIENRLSELETSLQELHGELDLTNPAWQNAIALIGAGAIDRETVSKINMSFAGDQAALGALRQVYQKANAQIGNLDELTYEVNSTFKELRRLGKNAFLPNANLNEFARSVGSLASLEGVKDFDVTPDEPTLHDAMRERLGMAS